MHTNYIDNVAIWFQNANLPINKLVFCTIDQYKIRRPWFGKRQRDRCETFIVRRIPAISFIIPPSYATCWLVLSIYMGAGIYIYIYLNYSMHLRDNHPFIENTPSLTSRSNERGDILTYMLVTCPSWRWSTLDWDWSVRLKGRSRSKRALATISGPIVFDETPMQAMQSITHINVRIHLWKIRDGWELGICIIISWVAFFILSWTSFCRVWRILSWNGNNLWLFHSCNMNVIIIDRRKEIFAKL